jgi:ribosomal protein S18 acetylase RimI-like enzyme
VSDVTIRRAGPEAIDLLEPLWGAMHEHHSSLPSGASELLAFRSTEESWKRRRRRYEEWLAQPDTLLLLAELDGRPVGYALTTIGGPGAAMVTGERTAEIESLSLLPEARGRGIGSRLMEITKEHLREHGVEVYGLGVMDGNDGARRFYERHGLRAFLVEMVGRV